jgi:ubiquinone/menaquinone biosynthesis C-methylase UbiE
MTDTDWDDVSKVIGHEDFFHKFVMHPQTIDLLGDVSGLTGADLGCGNGILVNKIINSGASSMFAVDISQNMLNIAKSNNKSGDVHYIQADLSIELPIPDKICDFVTQLMLLHTLKDVTKVILETHRVLKEGGELILVMPHPVALMKGRFISLQEFDTDNYLNPQEVEFLWNRRGMKIPMEFYSRPLGFYMNLITETGFTFEKMVEPPIPLAAVGIKSEENIPDEDFQVMRKLPWFLFLKFRKNG